MEFAFPPQGIISREQGNRTKAGEGGRCVFPSFFRSVLHPRPATFLSSGMFSCLSLPSSSLSPEDGFLSFSEKKEKEEDRLPCRIAIFRLPSREAVFFVPSVKCISLPSIEKRKRKEGNCHAVGIRRQEGGTAILLAFFSGRTFPPFLPKERKGKATVLMNFPSFKKKKKKKQKEKRRESPFFGAALPFCRKRGTPPDAESGRKKGKPSPAHRGESPLAFLSEKRKEEKKSTVLSLPPLLFRMFPLLHSSKRREAASHRYAGCSKRC